MIKVLIWEGVEMQLLPIRALYIPLYQILIISDWHLGKLSHFRQAGLFVPAMQIKAELERLGEALSALEVKKVVFLGDLFHSSHNAEWDDLVAYLKGFPKIDFILTKGNHDLISNTILEQSSLYVVDYLRIGETILLSHEPMSHLPDTILNIVGHVHPGVMVQTKGRQRFRLPCFYLARNVLTIPAFGRWTGLYIIKKSVDNRLFPILGDEVIEFL